MHNLVVVAEDGSISINDRVTQDKDLEDSATQHSEAEPEIPSPSIFNCPIVGDVSVGDKDPRSLVGTSVNVPNKLWADYENDKGKSESQIVGYSATTQVPNAKKPGAHVVQTDGEHYALDAAYHIFKTKRGNKK